MLCQRLFRNKQVKHADEDGDARMNADAMLLSDR
jgi:hypothetical protein